MKKIENSKEYYVSLEGFVYRNGRKLGGNRGVYQDVVISYLDGTRRRYYVHRLVAEVYIPNPENKTQVNHKDGNKYNNRVDNLEWVTPRENTQHAVAKGLRKTGVDAPVARLTSRQVHDICQALSAGVRVCDVVRKFGCHQSTVSAIKAKRVFTEISSTYDFPPKPHLLSASTVRWICQRMEDGLKDFEILAISTNPSLSRWHLYGIRQKLTYKDISIEFNI